VFNWRNALGLTVIFVAVGILYYALWTWINPTPSAVDWTGFLLLVGLGAAMGFAFVVLLRSSREL
jgi:divalent metal cation (Fe/Co/Zn/Cd) transporter